MNSMSQDDPVRTLARSILLAMLLVLVPLGTVLATQGRDSAAAPASASSALLHGFHDAGTVTASTPVTITACLAAPRERRQ
jgi:hypothetical protein